MFERSFDVKVSGVAFTVNLSNAPEELVRGVVAQGIKILLQRSTATTQDKPLTPREQADKMAKVAASLNDGTWRPGTGIGGGRLDDVEREFRVQYVARLVKAGVKASEATKYATLETREELYRDLVIKPQILAKAPERMGELDKLAKDGMEKMVASAGSVVDARNKAAEAANIEVDL